MLILFHILFSPTVGFYSSRITIDRMNQLIWKLYSVLLTESKKEEKINVVQIIKVNWQVKYDQLK